MAKRIDGSANAADVSRKNVTWTVSVLILRPWFPGIVVCTKAAIFSVDSRGLGDRISAARQGPMPLWLDLEGKELFRIRIRRMIVGKYEDLLTRLRARMEAPRRPVLFEPLQEQIQGLFGDYNGDAIVNVCF